MTSIDVCKRVSANTGYCLLGHQNEDFIWVLTYHTIRTCKHYMQSKAKQEKIQNKSIVDKATIPRHMLYLDFLKVTMKSGTSEN